MGEVRNPAVQYHLVKTMHRGAVPASVTPLSAALLRCYLTLTLIFNITSNPGILRVCRGKAANCSGGLPLLSGRPGCWTGRPEGTAAAAALKGRPARRSPRDARHHAPTILVVRRICRGRLGLAAARGTAAVVTLRGQPCWVFLKRNMSTIETLLNSVVLCSNLERVAELQLAESTAIHAVIDLVCEVITAADAQVLVDGVVEELTHPLVQGCIADSERTQDCRAAGAAAFAAGRWAEAAGYYSASLRWAEEGTTTGAEVASRLYCNRALCFAKLGRHQHALADSTCAVGLDARFAKAFYRRALAHQALGDVNAAATDAQQALQLQKQDGADAAAVKKLLLSLPPEPEAAGRQRQTGVTPEWTTHNVPLELHEAERIDAEACECSPKVQAGCSAAQAAAFVHSVSPALGVLERQGAGRELVAMHAVPPGTDIFREPPFAHAMCKSHRQTVSNGLCAGVGAAACAVPFVDVWPHLLACCAELRHLLQRRPHGRRIVL